jgi:hypothetical protein
MCPGVSPVPHLERSGRWVFVGYYVVEATTEPVRPKGKRSEGDCKMTLNTQLDKGGTVP